jgi:hypothetical protein
LGVAASEDFLLLASSGKSGSLMGQGDWSVLIFISGPLYVTDIVFLEVQKNCCIVIKNIQKLITIFSGRRGLVSS